MWKEMVRRCQEYFTTFHVTTSGRVQFIKYEDFVREPLRYGEQIVGHLGENMTRKVSRRLRKAHTKSIGIHKRRDPKEIEDATRIAREELSLLGYVDRY